MEYDEAVEKWARQWGRHGCVEWNTNLGCWCVFLTSRASDPKSEAAQLGLIAPEESRESVPLHEFSPEEKRYVPIMLDDLGVSGIIQILDEGNVWSGRGRFKSWRDSLNHFRNTNRANRAAKKAMILEQGAEIADLARRSTFSLPIVGYGSNKHHR